MKTRGNIFFIDGIIPGNMEVFEKLTTGDTIIERIVSHGQQTPEGEWYDQEKDEWVVLLQGDARLAFPDGTETALKAGDYLLLPAHKKHRVNFTSTAPPCIWLAIHGKLSNI
ncbi:MAG: cupin domain-containing protein [Lentimicrobium sp.]|nr:cupin domain-containing protein [Lentimicrobium sp.]